MHMSLSTKAGTLAQLSGKCHSARIAPLVVVTVGQWRSEPERCLTKILMTLGNVPLIVRSSCAREDTLKTSLAGAFLSCQNVEAVHLSEAIDRVIASYSAATSQDEVLVQPMLENVVCSGVAFSHDPNTNSPYRIVSWREGSDTRQVTGGSGADTWQGAANLPHETPLPGPVRPVLLMLEELLEAFQHTPIDCEFAITSPGGSSTLWLLQVRPLILSGISQTPARQAHILKLIAGKVRQGLGPHPFVSGKRTLYGVMPDWNPAEIIGIRPRPLALSLYRELITDAIWAYQRHNYGYRNLRSFPLMQHFFGLPYVDVRLSFNSFIPASLPDNIAGRLVDFYIDKLSRHPTLHDKIEFEIVYSCYTLDIPKRLAELHAHGFSMAETEQVANCLRNLTNSIIDGKKGLWRQDAAKLEILNERRDKLLQSDLPLVSKIYWLLEDTKRYGTLPFAGLARAGFVAVQILKSLVSVGVLTPTDNERFMSSLSTISKQMTHHRHNLDQATFLARYGHLRPGTYDLLSPRYDEAPELYFDWHTPSPTPRRPSEQEPPFSLTLIQMRAIGDLLKDHGLNHDVVGLFEFLQAGIELREYAKFCFTRNVSDALGLMTSYGISLGITAEEMAFCDVRCFQELEAGALDPQEVLLQAISRGRSQYENTRHLALPPVIRSEVDVWAFSWPETVPNFVTQKRVIAPVVAASQRHELADAIVFIPNADPGYDWLFSYPIAGLVTAWGGINSHMAIRAGELGLPAVIGAGEANYRHWACARRLTIDCALRLVKVLE